MTRVRIGRRGTTVCAQAHFLVLEYDAALETVSNSATPAVGVIHHLHTVGVIVRSGCMVLGNSQQTNRAVISLRR